MYSKFVFSILLIIFATSCNKCDQNKAMNKSLALGKIQGRLFARGGEGTTAFAAYLMKESGAVSELIAQEKYNEACTKADEIAKQYNLDLDKEQKDMVTFEQLAKDGGKGTGSCSIGDAATKQMELHGLLQAEVDAGRKTSDIFNQFNEDTKGYAEMLSTNPSDACKLFDKLKEKYGLKG